MNAHSNNALLREFYLQDTVEAARALLGKVLVHRTHEGASVWDLTSDSKVIKQFDQVREQMKQNDGGPWKH